MLIKAAVSLWYASQESAYLLKSTPNKTIKNRLLCAICVKTKKLRL
jgi:hypothetical protein